MLRENYSRSGRSPTTQAQRTAAVTGMVECLTVVKLAVAAVELAAGSGSSKSSYGGGGGNIPFLAISDLSSKLLR